MVQLASKAATCDCLTASKADLSIRLGGSSAKAPDYGFLPNMFKISSTLLSTITSSIESLRSPRLKGFAYSISTRRLYSLNSVRS